VNEDDIAQEPLRVPFTALSPTALRGVIEAFVLREGTDYGEHIFSLVDKVAHVTRQLERGEAEILFDPKSNSTAIVPRARR
jgi:uncharacterized protein YheU (UPF0270 family)